MVWSVRQISNTFFRFLSLAQRSSWITEWGINQWSYIRYTGQPDLLGTYTASTERRSQGTVATEEHWPAWKYLVLGTFSMHQQGESLNYTYQFFPRRLDPEKSKFSVWSDWLHKVSPRRLWRGSQCLFIDSVTDYVLTNYGVTIDSEASGTYPLQPYTPTSRTHLNLQHQKSNRIYS